MATKTPTKAAEVRFAVYHRREKDIERFRRKSSSGRTRWLDLTLRELYDAAFGRQSSGHLTRKRDL